jgi:hypothetical protein
MKYHTPLLCTQNILLKNIKKGKTFQANPINKTDTVNLNLLLLKNREAISPCKRNNPLLMVSLLNIEMFNDLYDIP